MKFKDSSSWWWSRTKTKSILILSVSIILSLPISISQGAVNLPGIIQQSGRSAGGTGPYSGDDSSSCSSSASSSWSWPTMKLGNKNYYVGHFFKANWFKAWNYCRFHGLHLASIESKSENDMIEKAVNDIGYGNERFWTSGNDLGEEGEFTWFGKGSPVSFTNWNAGEPNNFKFENGEEEHCLELWNRDGKGLKWNDTPCSFETYFICER